MKEVVDSIIKFENDLRRSKSVREVKFEFFNSPANSKQLDELEQGGKIEQTVLDFYRVSDGFEFSWQPTDASLEQHEIIGRVRINPFQEVVRNWKGVVFFDDEPENTPRRKFFPTDFFVDEAAAGFCTLEGYRNMMYLFRFEGDLIPLDVNFKSYLKCMLMAKGCFYWQYLLVELISGQENAMSERIKQHLPRVFPDFTFQSFESLFNELRIR